MNQTEEVFNFSFISNSDASVVLQPGIQPFNLPTSFVSSQLSSVRCLGLYPVSPVKGNQFNTFLPRSGVQWITIVGTISDQALWLGCDKSRCESHLHKGDFMWRSTFQVMATGRPERSATAMSFVPLPAWSFPQPAPFFGRHEGAVNETFEQI